MQIFTSISMGRYVKLLDTTNVIGGRAQIFGAYNGKTAANAYRDTGTIGPDCSSVHLTVGSIPGLWPFSSLCRHMEHAAWVMTHSTGVLKGHERPDSFFLDKIGPCEKRMKIAELLIRAICAECEKCPEKLHCQAPPRGGLESAGGSKPRITGCLFRQEENRLLPFLCVDESL